MFEDQFDCFLELSFVLNHLNLYLKLLQDIFLNDPCSFFTIINSYLLGNYKLDQFLTLKIYLMFPYLKVKSIKYYKIE